MNDSLQIAGVDDTGGDGGWGEERRLGIINPTLLAVGETECADLAVGGSDDRGVIDERAFADDEFLPYWAELWPSARRLAAVVAESDMAGLRVLERTGRR